MRSGPQIRVLEQRGRVAATIHRVGKMQGVEPGGDSDVESSESWRCESGMRRCRASGGKG
jgi:hypothetical protein